MSRNINNVKRLLLKNKDTPRQPGPNIQAVNTQKKCKLNIRVIIITYHGFYYLKVEVVINSYATVKNADKIWQLVQ